MGSAVPLVGPFETAGTFTGPLLQPPPAPGHLHPLQIAYHRGINELFIYIQRAAVGLKQTTSNSEVIKDIVIPNIAGELELARMTMVWESGRSWLRSSSSTEGFNTGRALGALLVR